MTSKRSGTPTTTNANRGRPMVTLTLAPKTLATIDRLRGQLSRGRYVDLVVKLCPVVADEWLKDRDPNLDWMYGD